MESKNLIIAFTWTFVLVSAVVLSWQGLVFAGYMMLFVMALVAALAVDALIPGVQPAGTELQREVRELRARLDELNGESRLA